MGLPPTGPFKAGGLLCALIRKDEQTSCLQAFDCTGRQILKATAPSRIGPTRSDVNRFVFLIGIAGFWLGHVAHRQCSPQRDSSESQVTTHEVSQFTGSVTGKFGRRSCPAVTTDSPQSARHDSASRNLLNKTDSLRQHYFCSENCSYCVKAVMAEAMRPPVDSDRC